MIHRGFTRQQNGFNSLHREVTTVALILWVGIINIAISQDVVETIFSDDAREYVGKKITVKMTVKAAKNSVKRKTIFLDSKEDFNDPKNLGLTLDEAAQQKFAASGIAEPDVFYKGKSIRVTGIPQLQDERVYIKVDEPSQIVVD